MNFFFDFNSRKSRFEVENYIIYFQSLGGVMLATSYIVNALFTR